MDKTCVSVNSKLYNLGLTLKDDTVLCKMQLHHQQYHHLLQLLLLKEKG
jgi:hypothetical protein